MDVEKDGRRVRIDLVSDRNLLSFQIAVIRSDLHFGGSFPQSRISLERHGDHRGHPGIHFQIKYHKVENPLDIGSLYILLDIGSGSEMRDVAEGFIYSLFRMFSEFEEGLDPLGTHIFYEGLVKELAGKEKVFKESVWNSLSQRDIQIIKLDGAVEFVGKEKLSRLIEERKELSLLLRP